MTQGFGATSPMSRNVAIYPWFRFVQNLVFWQAIWFLFFQTELSGAEAIMLYAVYDVATTAMEVPSGYMSDRLGRRRTLIAAAGAGAVGSALIALGSGFMVFAVAQVFLGVSAAFASGTDSALLYESLAAQEREDEVEEHEALAWQAALIGLALSAITGGVMASYAYELAFAAGTVAFGMGVVLVSLFAEPPHERSAASGGLAAQWQHLRAAMARPVLVWLFALSVLMYGFSHVPFVFGQPFIEQSLEGITWSPPVVSGAVSGVMMLVSVVASVVAVRLRARIGLGAMLLLAFAIQIGIIAVLAVTNAAVAIVVLFLRMVPNSFARPFIVARMQPLLNDEGRATYLSLQSFAGRLAFAGSLLFASTLVQQGAAMTYADIQLTMVGYGAAGLIFFVLLASLVRWARLDPS